MSTLKVDTITDEAGTGAPTLSQGLTVAGNVSVDGGTIKLDGNYPVGTNNVALGNTALDSNVSGGYNTAIGADALTANTSSQNVAVGYQAGFSNTTAGNNVLIGYKSGYTGVTATQVTGLGSNTLVSNTGSYNTGLGYGAMYANTSGASNTAVGVEALVANTTASNNTAVGYQAGYSNTTGVNNAYFGIQTGYSVTTGQQNSFLGQGAGYYMTTGSKNTILGGYTGNQGGLDIRTSSNNIVLSDGDGNPRVLVGNSGHTILSSHGFSTVVNSGDKHVVSNGTTGNYTCVFENVTTGSPYGLFLQFPNLSPNNTGNTFISAADSSTNRFLVFSNGNVVNTNNSYGAISDVKLKENIVDASSQWDDIKALIVRKYSMKSDNLDAPNMLGVIAQEVESAGMGGLVFESPDKDSDNNDLGTVTKQVNYSILYMKAVKALQEAMDRIETLEADVAALKNP